MPNENSGDTTPKPKPTKYDSGHIVVPVLHPSGDVHSIAVPEDLPVSDLHDALLKHDYTHPALESRQPQPSPEDTLEESPEFQKANQRIFDSMNHGKTKGENAAYLYANKPATVTGEQFNETAGGGRSMHINIPPDATALTRTENRFKFSRAPIG